MSFLHSYEGFRCTDPYIFLYTVVLNIQDLFSFRLGKCHFWLHKTTFRTLSPKIYGFDIYFIQNKDILSYYRIILYNFGIELNIFLVYTMSFLIDFWQVHQSIYPF